MQPQWRGCRSVDMVDHGRYVPRSGGVTSIPAYGTQVVCGELSDALLDQLSALSSEVFLPLLANRANAAGAEKALPKVVAKGLTDGLQKFMATGSWLNKEF